MQNIGTGGWRRSAIFDRSFPGLKALPDKKRTQLRMKRIALMLGAAATLWGCSTDLDINAPYKDITVVYGLLNMRDSVHYIKINKAFLGEGDALTFAQIADSNEWADADITSAKVYRVVNGTRTESFDLTPTVVTGREPGIFYGPDQKVYTFSETFTGSINQAGQSVPIYLNPDWEYDVELEVKGETITSRTTIVNDFVFQGTDQSPDQQINLVSGSNYTNFELNWTSSQDGKRYVADYRFNWKEVRGSDTSELLSFTQRLGSVVRTSSSAAQPMAVIMEGEQFFSGIANQIPADPTVTKRIFLGVDFLVSVANEEFHTYLTLSEPVSGIIEDRPSYSNITNGYGIFGSRYTKAIIGKTIAGNTLQELAFGNYTGPLLFCSGMPQNATSPNFCGN